MWFDVICCYFDVMFILNTDVMLIYFAYVMLMWCDFGDDMMLMLLWCDVDVIMLMVVVWCWFVVDVTCHVDNDVILLWYWWYSYWWYWYWWYWYWWCWWCQAQIRVLRTERQILCFWIVKDNSSAENFNLCWKRGATPTVAINQRQILCFWIV